MADILNTKENNRGGKNDYLVSGLSGAASAVMVFFPLSQPADALADLSHLVLQSPLLALAVLVVLQSFFAASPHPALAAFLVPSHLGSLSGAVCSVFTVPSATA